MKVSDGQGVWPVRRIQRGRCRCRGARGGDGKAIEGLFAVGNDAASIFGGSYPGAGATLGPAMTFGYICGTCLAGKTANSRPP
jgi:hypothetical protein